MRTISSGSWGIVAQFATIESFVPIPLKPFHTFAGIVTNLKRCDNQEIYQQRIKLVEEGFQRILEGVQFDCE